MYLTFLKCSVDKTSKVIKIWITKNLLKLSECLGGKKEKERKIENQAIEELRKLRTYQKIW